MREQRPLGVAARVDSTRDLTEAYFAETVAMNRGVNVRLFPNVAVAASWLTQA